MIKITELCKAYGGRPVLEHYSAVFEGNSILMGASGSGKTTLFRLIMGLERPDSGRVEVTGRLAAVFQEDRLCEGLNALQNVRLVLSRKTAEERLRESFAAVGLTGGDLQKPVFDLSGGMARRVAIVRAMMADSDIVILDEPFKGLDPDTKAMCMAYVKTSVESAGKSLLLSTHVLEEAEVFGGRIYEIIKKD